MKALLIVFSGVVLFFFALWLKSSYTISSYMSESKSIESYDFGDYGVSDDDVDLFVKFKNGSSAVVYSVENDIKYLSDTKRLSIHAVDGHELYAVGCSDHRVVSWSDSWDVGYESYFDMFGFRSLIEFSDKISTFEAIVSDFKRCPDYVEIKRKNKEIYSRYCVSDANVIFTSKSADSICLK